MRISQPVEKLDIFGILEWTKKNAITSANQTGRQMAVIGINSTDNRHDRIDYLWSEKRCGATTANV